MFDDIPADGPPARELGAQAASPSPSVARFHSCRWHKPAEAGQPEHCTQRDVLSMAGVHGFSPEAWCTDCAYYKVRRVPRRPQVL